MIVEEYPGAAEVIEEQKNLYAQIWEADELYDSRKIGGAYYPFSGPIEWEVVEWLNSLNVPMKKIDEFLRLSYVSGMLAYELVDFQMFHKVKCRPFSFSSAREMRARVDILPSPPRWKKADVDLGGGTVNSETTVPFYYRDGLESFKFLFGNPLFRDHM